MAVKLRIPTPLRRLSGGAAELSVEGATIKDVLSALERDHPGFRERIYDESGQILTTSLMDYLLPSAADVPSFEFGHLETYCPISVGGIKGMGEGGAIASPVAVANAVSDALAPFGWKPVSRLPMTPELVHRQATD